MDNLTGQKYCNFFEYASFVGIFVRICGLCPSVEWQCCTFACFLQSKRIKRIFHLLRGKSKFIHIYKKKNSGLLARYFFYVFRVSDGKLRILGLNLGTFRVWDESPLWFWDDFRTVTILAEESHDFFARILAFRPNASLRVSQTAGIVA